MSDPVTGSEHSLEQATVEDASDASTAPEFSIIIPVYNEAENIGPLLRGIEASVEGSYEILIVYDFEEDTTLAAVAALDPPVPRIRLVHNRLGKGVVNAIRAGFAQADGWLGAVVTMGDLSDPPDRINALVAKLREGCDVVAGSRYMPGGKMVGGPWLKRNLSRLAGVSARWLTGIGIHDITTNFRAYSRRLFQTIPIQSRGGFELGLELTVKCHLRGWRVGQIPSAWYDRTAGQSRFQLLKWLPGYLRWYLLLLVCDPMGLGARWRAGRNRQAHYTFFGVYDRPGYGWIVGRSEPGVMVLAYTTDGKIILVRAHRPYHRQGQTSWEIPGGGKDPGETIEQAAARELHEETGFRAGSDIRVLPTCFQPVPGMAIYDHHLVIIRGCQPGPKPDAREEGIHEVRTADADEIQQLLDGGEITALPTIAALHFSTRLTGQQQA